MLAGAFLFFSCYALELTKVSIEYHSFLTEPRLPMIPQHTGTSEMGVRVDVNLLGPVFWRNFVHSLSDNSPQVRHVGYWFEVGAKVGPVEAGYQHHSEHQLESQHPLMRFGVRDSGFIRLYLFEKIK